MQREKMKLQNLFAKKWLFYTVFSILFLIFMTQKELQDIFLSHDFELSTVELAQFEKFLTLFIEYNTHTNLSAIRDETGIIEKHFIDSLYGASIIV